MNALDTLNNYWTLILSICSIVFWALWIYFKVQEHAGRIERLEADTLTNTRSIDEIRSSIASIDAKLGILIKGYESK
jgi:hypothetical protein